MPRMRRVVLPVAAVIVLAGPAAWAQESTVRGDVTGSLTRGQRVTFEVDATHPDGWASITEVGSSLELHGAVLEELRYDVDRSSLTTGRGSVLAGTGDDLTGRFFRITGGDIEVTTGGNELSLTFAGQILEAVPQGARFRFTALDGEGEEISTSLRAAVPADEEDGFPIATVIAAALAALLAGGFFGSRVAEHRRQPSIYDRVAQRVVDERSRGPGTPP